MLPRLQRSIGSSEHLSAGRPPCVRSNRWMKGGTVSRNRSLTMYHSFSNPHPSSPYLPSPLAPLTGPPFFPLRLLFIHLLQPFLSSQISFPGPRGRKTHTKKTPVDVWLSTNNCSFHMLHVLRQMRAVFPKLGNTPVSFAVKKEKNFDL